MFNGLFKKESEVMNKDDIAEILKTNPDVLKTFEEKYKPYLESNEEDNFFQVNSRLASKLRKEKTQKENNYLEESEVNSISDKIVEELLISSGIKKGELNNLVTKEQLNSIEPSLKPQLTSTLIKKDINRDSYPIILMYYKKWKEEGNIQFYHQFRQGLDILDLDPIVYEMIGMNPNSMGFWLPEVEKAISKTDFFKTPKTKVIKVPLPILQLTRTDYQDLTSSTMKIVNDFCMEAFELDVKKKYFIKTGTYSSKFDFRNAVVAGEQEVRELGEYLLYIHFQALQMASPLSRPTIYGVSTTNEWVVREFIEDKENNPTIYKGMPLHTEYRVFVDFDKDEILGITPYWREDIMKKSFSTNENVHKKHDYVVYKAHEDTLYKRYYKNKDKIVEEIKQLMAHMSLPGQWSIDIMQNGDDFYVVDLAMAVWSALNDCVEPGKLEKPQENWIPTLSLES